MRSLVWVWVRGARWLWFVRPQIQPQGPSLIGAAVAAHFLLLLLSVVTLMPIGVTQLPGVEVELILFYLALSRLLVYVLREALLFSLYSLEQLKQLSLGMLSLSNPERDLDLTTSTDFEDLACFGGDLAEFVYQDVSLWADVSLGGLLGGALGFLTSTRLAARFLK